MGKLGPWIRLEAGGYVRYPDPPDGRVWELDGSPRYVVCVTPCCGPPMKPPETIHFSWFLSDYSADGRKLSGDEKTLPLAQEKADEALRAAGWSV